MTHLPHPEHTSFDVIRRCIELLGKFRLLKTSCNGTPLAKICDNGRGWTRHTGWKDTRVLSVDDATCTDRLISM